MRTPLEHAPGPRDAATVARGAQVLRDGGEVAWHRRFLPFLGPAFVAAVAYVDPGELRHQHPGRGEIRLSPPLGDRGEQHDGNARPTAVGQAGNRDGP